MEIYDMRQSVFWLFILWRVNFLDIIPTCTITKNTTVLTVLLLVHAKSFGKYRFESFLSSHIFNLYFQLIQIKRILLSSVIRIMNEIFHSCCHENLGVSHYNRLYCIITCNIFECNSSLCWYTNHNNWHVRSFIHVSFCLGFIPFINV